MGVVYLGCHRETGERHAVKTVRLTHASTLASIRREVQALSRIHHPGIIRIVDHGFSAGLPWYAMELLEGHTLKQLISRYWKFDSRGTRPSETHGTSQPQGQDSSRDPGAPPALPSRPLLRLLRRLCAPLAYLHGRGLVHRDLKPGNIFIRADGTVVLGDFGGAVAFAGAGGREVLQVDGNTLGTLLYMAPEQIRGDLVDARADLYALGCILYECVTGLPPFVGGSDRAIRRRHLQSPPPPPSEILGEELPERLEWLILELLEKHPEDRLGYAEDVARVLSELEPDIDAPVDLPPSQPYLYRPRFTGRTEAVSELRTRLDALSVGRGGKIFVGGASGTGKTRLALEMARESFGRELSVVTCECVPLGLSGTRVDARMRAPPLHPFRSLLTTVADRCRHWGTEETERLLGPRGKVLVPYEPRLDELPGQKELPAPPPLSTEKAERARIFSSLHEVLFALAEEDPLLLIIDDLQWADELTLGFLRLLRHEHLAERGVLLLGTYRPEELEGTLREVVSAPEALRLELGRLDTKSIQSMACGMLALQSLPRDFDRLVRQCEGNPFFVAEYLRAAITEGLLHRDGTGRWRLDERAATQEPLHSLGLPGSIAELIHLRLRDLDPQARALVELAAVLGREFEAELLLEASELDDASALEGLETLRVRQILEETSGGRLRFLHDKLRELSYGRIPPEHCHRLHHRAAEAIERRALGALDFALGYPALAHHWSKARVPERASHYFGLAADHARSAHAHSEAIAFYRAALAEADEHLRTAREEPEDWRERLRRLHESLGDVLALTVQRQEAHAAYGQALLRLRPDARVRRARVHRKRGKTWETHHLHEDALRAYDEAEAALGHAPVEPRDRARPDPEETPVAWWHEWVQVQVDRHWTCYGMNRCEEMAELVRKVRPVVETHGTPRQRAGFFVLLLNTAFRQERYVVSAEMVEYGRLAVRASDESGDVGLRVQARFCHAFGLLHHGDLDEAERQGLAGLRLAERTGDLTMKSRLLAYLTLVYRKRGQVAETRAWCERSLEAASAAHMDDYVGAARANRAWVAWKGRRFTEAELEARAALECWRKLAVLSPYPLQWQGLWLLLAIALHHGALTEALEHARALLDPKQQRLPDTLAGALTDALEAWSQNQTEAAREHLRRAVSSAQEQACL
jgi:serine/threonine protein kinase/tetratricopeptide (TPR) repeat protein